MEQDLAWKYKVHECRRAIPGCPFAVCTSDAFRETVTQPISMLMNKVNYTVRTNNWVTVSPTRGHGSVTNGSDINESQ